jgi:phage protein D
MTPIDFYRGQDFYVPEFQLKINGAPAGQEVIRDVLDVTYRDDLEAFDTVQVTINNWDAERRELKYVDSALFDPGGELELWMGYHGRDRLRLMTTAVITEMNPTFPASGQPTLVVSGQSLLHAFRRRQESDIYENKTDSEIAKRIGRRLQVKVRTNPPPTGEPKYEHIAQENEYDIVFLFKRARAVGYDLFVEEQGSNGRATTRRLYFGPSDGIRDTVYRLTYGRSLIDFEPTLDTSFQVERVELHGWNREDKEDITVTATRSDLSTRPIPEPSGRTSVANAIRDRAEVISCRPVENLQEAKKVATEALGRIVKQEMTASGTTIGLPDLRTGTALHIEGVGARFSGRYFVTSTIHSMGDGGYTTQFGCRREEV